jgi:ribosomal protein RSM22 (predicted rRNA methylase)
MAFRITWFDVVGKAIGALHPDAQVAREIERLSATFREGRHDFDYATPLRQAAYLWHLLPAHVCDISRLLLDLGELWDRPQLHVVAVGAGPGTEVLAALDAASSLGKRGQLGVERLRVTRVDRVGDWDRSFARLLPQALEQVKRRDKRCGEGWTLEAPQRTLQADLAAPPLPDEVLAAVAEADLVLMANLITEVPPRETEELPPGLADGLRQLFGAVRAGGEVVLVDRRGAPGAVGRLAAAAELAQACGATAALGPLARDIRCACALTKRAKQLYERVNLPTTKEQDRPVLNCRTAWVRLGW